jgi:hypothetical protein
MARRCDTVGWRWSRMYFKVAAGRGLAWFPHILGYHVEDNDFMTTDHSRLPLECDVIREQRKVGNANGK